MNAKLDFLLINLGITFIILVGIGLGWILLSILAILIGG